MTEQPIPTVSNDQLVSELWARDVQFLRGRGILPPAQLLPTAQLIASLAQSADSRVCFSLIPLFLRHPEYSARAMDAYESIPSEASRITLQFYYTAAIFLQKKYRTRINHIIGLQDPLPDLFSKQLNVSQNKDPDRALADLAIQHNAMTGRFVNWHGTYEHAADVWLRQMELQKAES